LAGAVLGPNLVAVQLADHDVVVDVGGFTVAIGDPREVLVVAMDEVADDARIRDEVQCSPRDG